MPFGHIFIREWRFHLVLGHYSKINAFKRVVVETVKEGCQREDEDAGEVERRGNALETALSTDHGKLGKETIDATETAVRARRCKIDRLTHYPVKTEDRMKHLPLRGKTNLVMKSAPVSDDAATRMPPQGEWK